MSDFALRFGLALIVVAVAIAAIIISRRNYAKSADFEHGIDALRLEFRRSIDAAHAATIKNVATTIRDNIFSVIRPIDSAVRDFDDRVARLEQQHADAAASHVAGTQLLDVRLARLEEHTDATAVQNLDIRLARLEERADDTVTQNFDDRLAKLEQHAETTVAQNLDARFGQLEERADANATQFAGARKQSLEENERLGARLAGLEQSLAVLSNHLSLIKEVIDGVTAREQDIKNSVEAVNSRIVDIQSRVDELFPRLALGEKAHKDLGTLISLFLKRLKRMNVNSTEAALRLGALEKHVRAKAEHLEEPRDSILEQPNEPSTSKIENLVEDARSKPADGPVPTEANREREKADGFERPSTSAEESSNEVSVEAKGHSDTSRADQHAT